MESSKDFKSNYDFYSGYIIFKIAINTDNFFFYNLYWNEENNY